MIVTLSNKQVNRIVFNYYQEQYPDPHRAMREYARLNMLLDQGVGRLYHEGRTVFFLDLQGTEIEFHSMGHETSAFAFVKNIYRLIDYVRTLPVTAIRTYGDNPVFEKLFQRVSVSATRDRQVGPDGHTYSYYRLEF